MVAVHPGQTGLAGPQRTRSRSSPFVSELPRVLPSVSENSASYFRNSRAPIQFSGVSSSVDRQALQTTPSTGPSSATLLPHSEQGMSTLNTKNRMSVNTGYQHAQPVGRRSKIHPVRRKKEA